MERRSFFEVVTGLLAGLLLPPLRIAEARLQRLKPLRWGEVTPRWLHFDKAVPVARQQDYIADGENDAKIVCALLRPARAHRTQVTDEEFLPAMQDAGSSHDENGRASYVGNRKRPRPNGTFN